MVFPEPTSPGEQADALELDEVMQPGLGLAVGVGLEQLVGMDRGFERQPGQGEVTQVHQLFSLSLRIATGEVGGSDAGLSH